MSDGLIDNDLGMYTKGADRHHHRYVEGMRTPDSYLKMLDKIGLNKDSVFLDIGGGSSQLADKLKELYGFSANTTDISSAGISSSREPVSLVNAPKQPFKAGTFTHVHSKDVLVHIENVREFFAEVYRLLKIDGIGVITFWEEPHNRMDIYFGEEREETTSCYFEDMTNYKAVLKAIKEGKVPDNSVLDLEMLKSYNQINPSAVPTSISPPYFSHKINDIKSTAEKIGFDVLYVKSYAPNEDEVDWSGPRRYFLVLKKTTK